MKVGVTGLIIPKDWTFEQTLENISKAGYESFELALRDTGYFSLESTDTDLKKVADQARSAGIELVSACPAISQSPKDLMTAGTSARREGIATFQECIRLTKEVGARTILVVLGALSPELYYNEAYKNALSSMRELAPMAEDAGINLAIEYVWNKFLLSPMEFAEFCDEVDSPNVGFYFDPGNMAIFSYPEHWVRICGRHLMAAHIKDFRREGSEWTPLLEGDVDFPAVMSELRKLRFNGALVSEVDIPISPLDETASKIRSIIAM